MNFGEPQHEDLVHARVSVTARLSSDAVDERLEQFLLSRVVFSLLLQDVGQESRDGWAAIGQPSVIIRLLVNL